MWVVDEVWGDVGGVFGKFFLIVFVSMWRNEVGEGNVGGLRKEKKA